MDVATSTSKTRPNIDAGVYQAIDTQDGFVVVRDVPIMGAVPKGEQGCPKDLKEKELAVFADIATSEYADRKYAAPLHRGHHRLIEINDPDFLGYVLPKRSGKVKLGKDEEPALFADLKLTKAAYQEARAGHLPYISVEAKWAENRIVSVALMASTAPRYKFPLFIPQEATSDETARFETQLRDLALMREHGEKAEGEGKSRGCCEHCPQLQDKLQKITDRMGVAKFGGHMDPKNDKTPVEPVPDASAGKPVQDSSRMSEDPMLAAKFAAQADELASLRKRLDERDAKETAKMREEKALSELAGFQLGKAMLEQIAKFSALGDESLSGLVNAIKEIAPKRPPRDANDFGVSQTVNVSATDPILAKFKDKGPEVAEHAMKLFGEWKAVLEKYPQYSVSAEKHIEAGLRDLKTEGVI